MQELCIIKEEMIREGEEPIAMISGSLNDILEFISTLDEKVVIVNTTLGCDTVFYVYRMNQIVGKEETKEDTTNKIKNKKYVKPTPEMILPGKKCRCITGSLAGTEGTIKNVTRPGKPDSETMLLSKQTIPTMAGDSNMRLEPLFSIPDKVNIEFDVAKEGETQENVKGIKRNIKGSYVGTTITKKQFCNNWKLIEE